MIQKSEYKIATESNDNLYPVGAINDNYTNTDLIKKVQNYFNRNIKMLDLGCAGGQFVVDFNNLGYESIGLEGSSSVLNGVGSNNWSKYYEKFLFLCDITKPFFLTSINGNVEKFDFIHCSEVIEHIKEEDLNSLFNNVKNHLNDDGIFCCQISLTPDVRIINGIEIVLHHSIFTPEKWKDILQKNGFEFCTGKTDYNHFGYLFGDTKFRDHQNT